MDFLTLCAPCVILQYVYKPTRRTKFCDQNLFSNRKLSLIARILCILLVYIHIKMDLTETGWKSVNWIHFAQKGKIGVLVTDTLS